MNSVIKGLNNGDLCLSGRTAACVSEFRTAKDIAVQAQMIADEMVLHDMVYS